MEEKIEGIHHITAIAGDPQQNLDFYTNILGLRFVKKTVNFDAPDIYHFYFADELGTPGTVMTFFPFPNAKRGTRGVGEISTVSFSVPISSFDFWIKWLSQNDIQFNGPEEKYGNKIITLYDPDGMKLQLVEDQVEHLIGWETKNIKRENSIRKFFGAAFYLSSQTETMDLLVNLFGFKIVNEEKNFTRLITGSGNQESKIDIVINSGSGRSIQSAGSVHHIAWRTESEYSQLEWLEKLRLNGLNPTDVIDRNYFKSIYFREPGGILFEIATDSPGFMVDEPKESLGTNLKLPHQYEHRRDELERILPTLNQLNSK